MTDKRIIIREIREIEGSLINKLNHNCLRVDGLIFDLNTFREKVVQLKDQEWKDKLGKIKQQGSYKAFREWTEEVFEDE